MSAGRTDTMPTAAQRLELEAVRAAARRQVFESSIPAEYRHARLTDLDEQTRHDINVWAASSEPTLILTGPAGSGKTHAGYAALFDAVRAGTRCYAATLADLHADTLPGSAPSPVGRLAMDADLFLFDDVDRTSASSDELATLDAVLAARIREGKRQILTSPMTLPAAVIAIGTHQ